MLKIKKFNFKFGIKERRFSQSFKEKEAMMK